MCAGDWVDDERLHAPRLVGDGRVAEAMEQHGQSLDLGEVDVADLL